VTELPLSLPWRDPVPGDALAVKRERLAAIVERMGRTLVAYSGGVDSTVLLIEAKRVLGHRVEGVIADSPSLPRAELRSALELAASHGIAVRTVSTREMEREKYRANGRDRCYHCKAELFGTLREMARVEGWNSLAYGAVTDDLGDERPGMEAARQARVRAPLLEAGWSKLEVRILARALGLPVWRKPQAACLASRVPHGTEVTVQKLAQVEQGEARLREAFHLEVLRLRHEGRVARLEVAAPDVAQMSAPETVASMLLLLKDLGFDSVMVDPRGYRRADPMPMDPREETVDAESR
jgi:uncharacterized protein